MLYSKPTLERAAQADLKSPHTDKLRSLGDFKYIIKSVAVFDFTIALFAQYMRLPLHVICFEDALR